jgi:negative regulator of flagellin synthesis FlgM
MATTPVNNKPQQTLSPLLTSNAAGPAAKSKAAGKADAGTGVNAAKPLPAPANAADVNISTTAKDRAAAHAKALEIARATPDVREDRVAALKAQIDAGTYQVDSGKIADGMMREAIKEHLADMEER